MDPTRSTLWHLHPGDYIIVEDHGGFLKTLARTPNDIEMDRLLRGFQADGRKVLVLQVKGYL